MTHPGGAYNETEYDAIGRVLTTRDENGNVTTHAYAQHQETITDDLGNPTVRNLDPDGQPSSITDARMNTTSFTYDRASVGHGGGRLIRIDYPAPPGTEIFATFEYDEAGRKTSETDAEGHTTLFGYDDLGRLTSVTNAEMETTQYIYDEVGNRLEIIDARQRHTNFEYDRMGWLMKRTLPLGQYETMTYDEMGNMTAKTDFNGDTTSFEFDDLNRMTSRTFPGETAVSFTYDAEGRRLSAGEESFVYDARGRLVSTTKATGETIGYGYDDFGNRTSITDPHGTTSYEFDELNRVSHVADPEGGITTYGYNPVGAVRTIALPNGVVTEHSYVS